MSEELRNVTLAANDMAREIKQLREQVAGLEDDRVRLLDQQAKDDDEYAQAQARIAELSGEGHLTVAEVLREAADKLALEMTPESSGAGPGFLLALRLCVRSLRRMSDEAAVKAS